MNAKVIPFFLISVLFPGFAYAGRAADPACIAVWNDLKAKIGAYRELGGTVDQLSQSLEETYSLWSKKLPELKSDNDRSSASRFLENSAQATRDSRSQNKDVLTRLAQESEALAIRLDNCMAGREEHDFFTIGVVVKSIGGEGTKLVIEGIWDYLSCGSARVVAELGAVYGEVQEVHFRLKTENCYSTYFKYYFLRETVVPTPAPEIKRFRFYVDSERSMYYELPVSPKN